jgi:hypothetical protein
MSNRSSSERPRFLRIFDTVLLLISLFVSLWEILFKKRPTHKKISGDTLQNYGDTGFRKSKKTENPVSSTQLVTFSPTNELRTFVNHYSDSIPSPSFAETSDLFTWRSEDLSLQGKPRTIASIMLEDDPKNWLFLKLLKSQDQEKVRFQNSEE